MSYCEDPDFVPDLQIYDMIGESLDRSMSSPQLWRYVLHGRPRSRELASSLSGGCDLLKEPQAEAGSLLFVPLGRVVELVFGLGRAAQPASRSFCDPRISLRSPACAIFDPSAEEGPAPESSIHPPVLREGLEQRLR